MAATFNRPALLLKLAIAFSRVCGSRGIAVSVGLHIGSMTAVRGVQAKEHYIGDGVQEAVAVQDVAGPGQILASESFYLRFQDAPQAKFFFLYGTVTAGAHVIKLYNLHDPESGAFGQSTSEQPAALLNETRVADTGSMPVVGRSSRPAGAGAKPPPVPPRNGKGARPDQKMRGIEFAAPSEGLGARPDTEPELPAVPADGVRVRKEDDPAPAVKPPRTSTQQIPALTTLPGKEPPAKAPGPEIPAARAAPPLPSKRAAADDESKSPPRPAAKTARPAGGEGTQLVRRLPGFGLASRRPLSVSAPEGTGDDPNAVPDRRRVPQLVALEALREFSRWPVTQAECVLGRADNCDIVLDHPSVSKRHVRLVLPSLRYPVGKVTVEDLGSTNGTLVDGSLVRETQVAPPFVLQVGSVVLLFDVGVKNETTAELFNRHQFLSRNPVMGCLSAAELGRRLEAEYQRAVTFHTPVLTAIIRSKVAMPKLSPQFETVLLTVAHRAVLQALRESFPRWVDMAVVDRHDTVVMIPGLGYDAAARSLLEACAQAVRRFESQIDRAELQVSPYMASPVGLHDVNLFTVVANTLEYPIKAGRAPAAADSPDLAEVLEFQT